MTLKLERLEPVRDSEGRLWANWKVALCPVCGGNSDNPGLGYSAFATKDGKCAVPFHRP